VATRVVLWHDGAHGASENMRRDASLLAAADQDPDFVPVLRLFQFQPRGITLGFSQDPARALDLARCERDGLDWAVRPTGGRAILHAREWTWSLTARIDDPEWGGSLALAFERVGARIASSLRRVGIPAASEGVKGGRAHAGIAGPNAACFASTARHEITLHGRKLVGSAQRRTAQALLQQGSILLGPGHLELADYVALPDAQRSGFRARLEAAAIDASRYVGEEAALGTWSAALEQELGVAAGHEPPGELRALLDSKAHPYTARRP